MDREILKAKISHLADDMRAALRDPKTTQFDPALVERWRFRFAAISKQLKSHFSELFSDLPDEQQPLPSPHGHVLRENVEGLVRDCEYWWEVLRLDAKPLEAQSEPPRESDGRRIFVSHASADKPLVEFFVEQILQLGLEVQTDDIFCTSLEGMDIRNGDDFRKVIRDALRGARLVLLIVTPNYKASEVCLNEMGAAWASEKRVIPLVVEPINYKSVGVVMEPKQIPKMSDPTSLSRLRDDVVQELGLSNTKTDRWDAKKRAFLEGIPTKIEECKFSAVHLKRDADDVVAKNSDLRARMSQTDGHPNGGPRSEIGGQSPASDGAAPAWSTHEMERFETLKENAKKALNRFPIVVRAIILCDYCHYEYYPPSSSEGDLQSAVWRSVLRANDDGYTPARENKDVRYAQACLTKLKAFLQRTASPTFIEDYEQKYRAEASVSSQDFWEEHFGFRVPE